MGKRRFSRQSLYQGEAVALHAASTIAGVGENLQNLGAWLVDFMHSQKEHEADGRLKR
jgi:hypothetical protein